MNDLLIRGIEIPTGCSALTIKVWPDGQTEVIGENGEQKVTDAVNIPPHGRLVDASEMFVSFVIEGQKTKRYKVGERWELNGVEIRKVIDSLETVIPSNKDEND